MIRIEKRRRGFGENKLVFIGMSNVASYYWCAIKSILTSRREEIDFFASYLADRVSYSLELGRMELGIDRLPQTPEELLQIGDNITFEDIEYLLRRKAERFEHISFNFEEKHEFKSLTPIQRGEYYHLTKAGQYPAIRYGTLAGETML